MILGDVADARRILDEFPKKYGDTAALHMKLGILYFKSRFFEEADGEFKRALALQENLKGAHYGIGASYLSQTDATSMEKAEVELRKELALDPNSGLAYAMLGKIALSRQKYAEAEVHLKRAIALNAKSVEVYLDLGTVYREKHEVPAAEAALRRAIAMAVNPSKNDYEIQQAHFWLGRLLIEDGQTAEGHKELDIARDQLYLRQQVLVSNMAGEESIELPAAKTHEAEAEDLAVLKSFEKNAGPIIASAYDNLGVHAATVGENAPASSYFEHAATWNPALLGIDSNWGRAAFAARKYGKAVGPLGRTLALHPTDEHIRGLLGLSLCLVRDYARAVQVFRPMEERAKMVPELSIAYVGSKAITSGSSEDLAQLKTLEEANENDALVHYLLGEAFSSKKQYSESADELKVALGLDPGSAEAKDALVKDYLALGQKTDAVELLSELAGSETEGGEFHYRLAELQIESGLAEAAIGNLEAAIRLSPRVVAYHQGLAEAFRKTAQPKAAEREALQSEVLQGQAGTN
jgi:tetratricopeptide (TPR) repeat protein